MVEGGNAPGRPSGRPFCCLTVESQYDIVDYMLKLSRNHRIYEVWNEWAAESVFVDHKPSKAEIRELVEKNEWNRVTHTGLSITLFIVKYVHVERLQHFYTYE